MNNPYQVGDIVLIKGVNQAKTYGLVMDSSIYAIKVLWQGQVRSFEYSMDRALSQPVIKAIRWKLLDEESI